MIILGIIIVCEYNEVQDASEPSGPWWLCFLVLDLVTCDM